MYLLSSVGQSASPAEAALIMVVVVAVFLATARFIRCHQDRQKQDGLSRRKARKLERGSSPPAIEMTSDPDRRSIGPVIDALEEVLKGPLAPDPHSSHHKEAN